jgi:PAS domain S-box-containing protein
MARSVVTQLSLTSGPEAKLSLLEALLGSEEAAECAERTVQWLVEHGGAEEALCLEVAAKEPRLVGLAAAGLRNAQFELPGIDLESRDNPFTAAILGRQVVVFEQTRAFCRSFGRLPLSAETLLLVPLFGERSDELPIGALLVAPVAAKVANEARRIAASLGKKLSSLRRFEALSEAERRLSNQAAQLRHIVNAVSDPVLLTDAEGRMIVANGRAETLFAALDGESEGRRRAIALNNMLFSAALAQVALSGKGISRRELPLVDPSEGSDLLFEMIASVADGARDNAPLVSVLRNVTDLRAATEELEANLLKLRTAEANVRKERDRLELVIDSVADPILVTDPAGSIVLMNTPAERLFTLASGVVNQDAQRAVRANDAQFSSFLSNLFFAAAPRWSAELGLIDPVSGETTPVEGVAGRVSSEHGELTAIVTILHDRREAIEKARLYEQLKLASSGLERKVAEATRELVRQNELLLRQHLALEQASKLKSQFLANVSHEFRTPLNAILGYTSMLLQGIGGSLTAHQHKNLERVDSNGRHLLAIINDILDISKIEAGRSTVENSEFGVRELVAEVVAEMEPLISRSRLEVGTEVDAELSSIRNDRKKIKQILLNLMSNALKFTTQGSIRISAQASAEGVTIAVTDTGIGIAPEHHAKIFEDFRQVDSSPTREYGGTGLGLAICRRLSGLIGARLSVESALGAGSCFELHLPGGSP